MNSGKRSAIKKLRTQKFKLKKKKTLSNILNNKPESDLYYDLEEEENSDDSDNNNENEEIGQFSDNFNNINLKDETFVRKPKKLTHKKILRYVNSDNPDDESEILSTKKVDTLELEFLPCRVGEMESISKFIKKGLDTFGSYSGLYISGTPGTGKTASVNAVINNLYKEVDKKMIPPFSHLTLNGMKITNPNNVFKLIYNHIFSDRKSSNMQKCNSILDNFFKNRKDYDCKVQLNDVMNPHLVLVVDEIDCLINKKQNLLYNIFNWATYPRSKLIIISISNTINLPEKLLPKVASRIGNNRLLFSPYQKGELIEILKVKIDNFHLFSEDAVRISAMKVAALNGDLRRILQICKRAEEIFYNENNKNGSKIQISHIIKATEELFDGKTQKVLQNLQIYEKFLICGIFFEIKLTGSTKSSVPNVYDKMKYFYNKTETKKCTITFDEYSMMVYNLAKLQIINFSDYFNENFIDNFLTLNFYTDEFVPVLENDPNLKFIMNEIF